MTRYVAFLRGMNLGSRRITNDELARHFADAGYPSATPYQASGNVVFDDPGSDAAALEDRIATHLQDALDYPVDTFIRSMAGLGAITVRDGLADAEADGFKVHVILLHGPPDPGVLDHLASIETDDDRFLARSGPDGAPTPEIYWLRRGRLSDSAIDASRPGVLTGGRTSTMRTLGTLRRVLGKFA